MNKAVLLLFLISSFTAAAAQTKQKPDEMQIATQAMCEAAAPKVKEAGTNQIVLMMTLNRSGQVQSFRTESPKGLNLEKNKEVAAKVKAIPFSPAKKDGSPVAVQVRIQFDCGRQPGSTSQSR